MSADELQELLKRNPSEQASSLCVWGSVQKHGFAYIAKKVMSVQVLEKLLYSQTCHTGEVNKTIYTAHLFPLLLRSCSASSARQICLWFVTECTWSKKGS